ncbi:GNAT family N-acetyltransferase [Streptomyces sp. NBC_00249]|uniref:GNAT family N-acetyltransferase n=1 Tax=Streptomyces sp. NBC_00249 TaxID=2975690 RepID=UPI002251AA55|nr:GNAT family N-acetyltransferase [Streptomyces sp. NBC_00249]MCX5197275.1 GNAT family N-acetyltransferase [Streptomyces sp. NBC_00249]
MTLVRLAAGDARVLADVGPLIRVLRPALDAEGFARFAAEAQAQGLEFTAAYDAAGRCLGAAGHRVLATSRGRVLFVDDLVTDAGRRSGGIGERLLDGLKSLARARGCVRIELDSGVTNQRAHRFYHRHGLTISALHFAVDTGR